MDKVFERLLYGIGWVIGLLIRGIFIGLYQLVVYGIFRYQRGHPADLFVSDELRFEHTLNQKSQEIATLNALAPGRIDAGFGTGYTGRRSMGLGPYKVSDMDEYIRVIMAMLRGEAPNLHIEGKTRKVGFLNPEAGLINIKDQIPVYVSALGPKTRRMTAELDAHWIMDQRQSH